MNLKNIYYAILKWYRSSTIRNKDVTIFSNNCWGGFMYQSCSLKYNTPLIGLYFYAPEYIKFLKDLKYNMEQPIFFIPKHKSKYTQYMSQDYIIGILGETGIEVVFMHYHSEQEILEKWERRKKRINYSNMIVKFSDTDPAREEEYIREFEQLPFKHKICFTGKSYPNYPSAICLKEFEQQGYVYNEWAYSYKYYNFVKEANKLSR